MALLLSAVSLNFADSTRWEPLPTSSKHKSISRLSASRNICEPGITNVGRKMPVAVFQPAWAATLPSAETQKPGVIEDTMDYGERLFHYTYATRHNDFHTIGYRTLHRYNIFHLQN